MEQIISFFQSDLGIKILKATSILFFIVTLTFIINKIIVKKITDNNSRYKTRKFINFFSYLLIAISIIFIFSSHLTGISVFLGVAGAGIAFALQEVIASIAGFIVIHFSNFYKVGDRVKLGGIKGDVIDIGILRTSLMEIGDWIDGDLYNGRITRVANSFVFKEPVYNYSGDFPFVWDEVKIPIKTDGDYKYAREEFLKIITIIQGDYAIKAKEDWNKMTEKLMIEKAKVEPMISMSFDENWITLTLRYVVDYKERRGTKDKIFMAILDLINQSNGKIEIASSSIEISKFHK